MAVQMLSLDGLKNQLKNQLDLVFDVHYYFKLELALHVIMEEVTAPSVQYFS